MKLKSVAVAAAILVASSTPAWADSDKPIKISVNEWTGQHVSAHMTGQLLRKAGYQIEYVTAGAVPQFAAIAQGDLHVQPETWGNNVGEIYPKSVANGDIVIVGPLGLEPREGWIYPPYMKEKCPGLPDYNALWDCAQAFATAESFPKGRLITYPADWGTRSKDLVKLLDVPLQPVAGGSEGAMIAEPEECSRGQATDTDDVLAATLGIRRIRDGLDPVGSHPRRRGMSRGEKARPRVVRVVSSKPTSRRLSAAISRKIGPGRSSSSR